MKKVRRIASSKWTSPLNRHAHDTRWPNLSEQQTLYIGPFW